jgi:hypothetical protein
MFRKVLMLYFVVVAFTCAFAQPCLAADWITLFQDPAAWPARLRSISFANGVTFDANHPLRIGAWTVEFGTGTPVVVRETYSGEPSCGDLQIQGLKCSNAVTGPQECEFILATGGRPQWMRSAANCFIESPMLRQGSPSKVPKLDINCPVDLKVE